MPKTARNALQAAASEGHQAIVQLLLDNKADVNAQGGGFGNALQAAAYNDHGDIIKLLLEINKDPGHLHPNFSMTHSPTLRTEEQVEVLLDNGAKIKDFHGSVEAGSSAAVSPSIRNGMKTDVPGGFFKYALHAAANYVNLTIVSLPETHLDVLSPETYRDNSVPGALSSGFMVTPLGHLFNKSGRLSYS